MAICALTGVLTINGTVGNVTGYYPSLVDGKVIYAFDGDVIITTRVGIISGSGSYDIYASTSYAIYDYVGVNSILDISRCNPAGRTVTFHYGADAATTGLPVCVYVSNNNTIPAYTAATGFAIGWYKEVAATTPMHFYYRYG